MQEGEIRKNAFTKANLHNLQILQNKVMRLQAKCGYATPVRELLKKTDSLSINQLIAYTSIMTIFKIKQFREPLYLARRLGFTNNARGGAQRRRHDNVQIDFNSARGREGILYRGAKLWNSLDHHLKNEVSMKTFKQELRKWVLNNIPALP